MHDSTRLLCTILLCIINRVLLCIIILLLVTWADMTPCIHRILRDAIYYTVLSTTQYTLYYTVHSVYATHLTTYLNDTMHPAITTHIATHITTHITTPCTPHHRQTSQALTRHHASHLAWPRYSPLPQSSPFLLRALYAPYVTFLMRMQNVFPKMCSL